MHRDERELLGDRDDGRIDLLGHPLGGAVPGTGLEARDVRVRHQLNVRPGDPAEIRVDAFPGLVLKGRVAEISPASGSQFALLPPDNATGNFTKVTQRVPVKIVFDDSGVGSGRLRPGLSVTTVIRTKGAS